MLAQILRRRMSTSTGETLTPPKEEVMSTREERLKILQMVADGTISPEDGMRLLEALSPEEGGGAESGAPKAEESQKPRWLKIQVTDTNTGRRRVNITLPLAVLRGMLKLGGRVNVVSDYVDKETLQALEDALLSGATGKFVDIVDEEDGERVEIFIE